VQRPARLGLPAAELFAARRRRARAGRRRRSWEGDQKFRDAHEIRIAESWAGRRAGNARSATEIKIKTRTLKTEVCGTLVRYELGEIEFDFVDVAPAPIFAGLDGAHDGVLGGVEMFCGVFIF